MFKQQPTSVLPLHAMYTWNRTVCRTGKNSGHGKSTFQQSSPFLAGQHSSSQRRAAVRAAVTCARKHFCTTEMQKATEASGPMLAAVYSGPVFGDTEKPAFACIPSPSRTPV